MTPKERSTRESDRQQRRKAEGLCIRCGEPRTVSKEYCDRCLIKRRQYWRKKRGSVKWKPGGIGRPPLTDRRSREHSQ